MEVQISGFNRKSINVQTLGINVHKQILIDVSIVCGFADGTRFKTITSLNNIYVLDETLAY